MCCGRRSRSTFVVVPGALGRHAQRPAPERVDLGSVLGVDTVKPRSGQAAAASHPPTATDPARGAKDPTPPASGSSSRANGRANARCAPPAQPRGLAFPAARCSRSRARRLNAARALPATSGERARHPRAESRPDVWACGGDGEATSSVVILELDVDGVLAVEAERQPQVAGHGHCPTPLAVPMQWVQLPARHVHIAWPDGCVEPVQHPLDSRTVHGRNSSRNTGGKEPLEPFMAKAADHGIGQENSNVLLYMMSSITLHTAATRRCS